MQSVRGVLRQSPSSGFLASMGIDAIRAGCAEAKSARLSMLPGSPLMQSVRGVLRQSTIRRCAHPLAADAIRAGCAEAKNSDCALLLREGDAIRAGCSETNGRALYSNDHVQNNEINRKESYPI